MMVDLWDVLSVAQSVDLIVDRMVVELWDVLLAVLLVD